MLFLGVKLSGIGMFFLNSAEFSGEKSGDLRGNIYLCKRYTKLMCNELQ